jgi:hypothetical protein
MEGRGVWAHNEERQAIQAVNTKGNGAPCEGMNALSSARIALSKVA